MSDLDGIDPSIPAGTLEYWKARARLWEARCKRSEREKTHLIAELNRLRDAADTRRKEREESRDAILRGDIAPNPRSRTQAP